MSVSLSKVEQQAPHLVSLVKATTVNLRKSGIDPEANKAAVVATIDSSGSARELYASGEIQRVTDMLFAAGLVFDDDGEVPVSLFDSTVHDLGSINLGNCKDFISRQNPNWGSTNYVRALQWIIEQAGFSSVDLSTGGLFGRGKQSVKATAAYPTFAAFVTDGEPNPGTENEIVKLLTAMSQLPIFVQFVGVGPWNFSFLHSLDELKDRFIDNAGFFDAKQASNQAEMLAGLLNEFPQYYQESRSKGLLG